MSSRVEVISPSGVPEVGAGDDLASLLVDALTAEDETLFEGDVVVVTSKVVSKAEGQVRVGDRDEVVAAETARVVARRGRTTIVRTRHGLTTAAAGVDASNVPVGRVALLPVDPDASARRLRAGLAEVAGVDVGVVVTDTAGRAWREGQTDLAIGAAGIVVLDDHAGRTDTYGNPLAVTAPAVADEIAAAAELAGGKLTSRPFAVVRGRSDLVLPAGTDGSGAAALIRPEADDLFGYGAREAVVRALAAADGADGVPGARGFGSPAAADDLAVAVAAAGCGQVAPYVEGTRELAVRLADTGPGHGAQAALARLRVLAAAYGWTLTAQDPTTPHLHHPGP